MKKIHISILLIIAALLSFTSVMAESDINIYVDGAKLECAEPAYIDNGRTMVPMRNIFESLDAEVVWVAETKPITVSKGDLTVILQINSADLFVNGKDEKLDTAPVMVNGTTFVPARAVSQALGADVLWDESTRTVYITSSPQNSDGKEETSVVMYAPDGRTLSVPQSEVEAYKNVGWYTEPVVTMYAADGRTLNVVNSEVEAYKNVGWYTEPVVTMYAADGRTLNVVKSEVDAYKRVGWYTEPYTPPKSSSGSGGSYSPSSGSTYTGTVYITPTGSKYHYSAGCAGKNAIATSLSSARSSGYAPCKKCAR